MHKYSPEPIICVQVCDNFRYQKWSCDQFDLDGSLVSTHLNFIFLIQSLLTQSLPKLDSQPLGMLKVGNSVPNFQTRIHDETAYSGNRYWLGITIIYMYWLTNHFEYGNQSLLGNDSKSSVKVIFRIKHFWRVTLSEMKLTRGLAEQPVRWEKKICYLNHLVLWSILAQVSNSWFLYCVINN